MKALTLLPAHETLLKEEHVEAFKALAHETRMRVFVHLVRADREAPAGEIQETLGVPGPTLSTTWTSSAGRASSRAGRKSATSITRSNARQCRN